jgi:hypothetical protein
MTFYPIPTGPVQPNDCKVYYCPVCRGYVYRTDNVAALPSHCERCKRSLTWVTDSDPESIADHIGIPVDQWVDLTV